jgi:CDP-4-dehydro-6-deoxyglucose reductase
MAEIRVGSKGSFVVSTGETILEAGLCAGFGFPKACRNGNCGRCAGRLVNGEVRLGNALLRADDAGSDQVLYCVATAETDCEIDAAMITAPGELPVASLRCQITAIQPLNYNVSAVTLRLPAGQKLNWYAGQYLLLGEQQDAAFSIANAATQDGRDILLHIRHDSDNLSAVELMTQLQQQNTVPVTLPLGNRWIDPAPSQPVWFICGSTGFAPARAMIERLMQLNFDLPVRLFRGGRRADDIYPPQWSSDPALALKDFQQTLAVNEAPASGQFHGMVHEAAIQALQDPTAPLFHVGGSPVMAWAVFDALVAAGVPPHHIHSDVFDYAPR